jgi:hypothetical protein
MAYKTETFNTSEERNARWQELRRQHPGTIRYSGSEKLDGRWQTKFYVGFPIQLMPRAVHE